MSRRLIKSMPNGSFLMLLLFIAVLVSAWRCPSARTGIVSCSMSCTAS